MPDTMPTPAVILSDEMVDLSFVQAAIPGYEDSQELGGIDPMTGFPGVIKPPVDPLMATKAVKENGELAAVLHAVANGCAGVTYKIVPRKKAAQGGPNLDDPSSWDDEIRAEHYRLQAFTQAGFHGSGVKSLRAGFYEQEHDRAVLGWGGVTVFRDEMDQSDTKIPKPRALGRFQAVMARFTKPGREATATPVPIVAEDGTVLWIEEMRHFRKIFLQARNSRGQWYKEYGDWRFMDRESGVFARNNRRRVSKNLLEPGMYFPGTISGKDPAVEVMHWATSFPGAAPYGISGWHSEMSTVETSAEAASLLLSHLKSGLHGVILAAGNRQFDNNSVDAATAKINELGRGRKGLGALITLALIPTGSDGTNNSVNRMLGDDMGADRGRLILHELNTKIAPQIIDGTLKKAGGDSFARSERVPGLLIGKSEAYNFATAGAAWRVVNRLRFAPHHEERGAFLSRLCVEMGIRHWTLELVTPEWEEAPSTTGIATVAGQNGGLTPNIAFRMISDLVGVQFKQFDGWWGDIPMPILTAVLSSPDPVMALRLFGLDAQADLYAKMPKPEKAVVDDITATLQSAENALAAKLRE